MTHTRGLHTAGHLRISTNTTAFHFVLAVLTHEVGEIEAVIARAIVKIVAERLLTSRALLTLLVIRNLVTLIVVAAHVRAIPIAGRRPEGATAHANAELFAARVVVAHEVHARHVAFAAHVVRIQFLSVTHRFVDCNAIT